MHLTYCSSREPFDPSYAPDWRPTTQYATDEVRYQYSDDNGKTWSNAQIIIEPFRENNQDNLYQGACTSSLIYYKGFYYLYFESYSPPSGILAIHVARSTNSAGPYEVWTYDGWKPIPTNSVWKPVLNPAIRSVSGAEEWLASRERNGPWSNYWGAGIPRVTQKDGKLYLYFVDTTNWIIWSDGKEIHEYGMPPKDQIPYNLVAISEDPTRFENIYDNRLVDEKKAELWNAFNPKYFPEEGKFYNFYLRNINGQNKVAYRTSTNGIVWSDETAEIDAISGNLNPSEGDPSQGNNVAQLFHNLTLLSDKNGMGKLSDLYTTYQKEYILDNAPVGWRDTPDYKWYYGGVDIYGLKVNLPVSLSTTTITTLSPTTTLLPTITMALPSTTTILSLTTTTVLPTTIISTTTTLRTETTITIPTTTITFPIVTNVTAIPPTPLPTQTTKPLSVGNTIIIRARGSYANGSYPVMELSSGNASLTSWKVTGAYRNYTFQGSQPLGDTIKVRFTNDYYNPKTRKDRNLYIYYIKVNDRIYYSADPSVYQSGVYSEIQKSCISGYLKSQISHCQNGYFEFKTK